MAGYLMANGAPTDMHRALYAYNHLWSYVETMLAIAASYGYVDPASIPAQAVELARSKIGSPYVWGAEGPDIFGCSGLVLWVYGQLGLQVPRTAQQQFDWATPIDTSELQPGDLTFSHGRKFESRLEPESKDWSSQPQSLDSSWSRPIGLRNPEIE